MDYPTFVRRQHNAIMTQFFRTDSAKNAGVNLAFIAIPGLDWLSTIRPMLGPGGNWGALQGTPVSEALVWRGGDGESELWVRPEEKSTGSGRYGRYWAAFCAQQGVAGTPGPVNGRAMAVDHLFPETTAARRKLAYVRAVPVDARSNSLVGSGVEKAEANRGGKQRPRTATYITLAKVSGFQGSFARRNTGAGIASALIAYLKGLGYTVPATYAIDPAMEEELTAESIEWTRGTPTSG